MKTQPTTTYNPTFGNIYKYTKFTSYGKCIHGNNRGFDYDVFVKENEITKDIEHKLYYIAKGNKFIKSVLRFFSNNKVYKEIKGQGK